MHGNTDSDASTTRRSFLTRTAAAAGAATAAAATAGTAAAQDEPDYGDWFSDVDNYDGTYDFTGQSEVTVTVGAAGNGGNLAFGPAAIRVDPGTTVVWEWNGKGGSHNVVADNGDFESDMYSSAGETFEYAFESEGTFKYFCQPHKMMGMKGAVVVGGSGGKDPSELESASSGGEGGDGEEGSDGEEGGDGDSKQLTRDFSGATIATAILMGLLSPLVFAGVLFYRDAEDGGN